MWKARKNARFTHHFREEFIIVKMAIREKFIRFKKIFTPGFWCTNISNFLGNLKVDVWLLVNFSKFQSSITF